MKEFFLVFDEFNDEIVRSVSGMAMVAVADKPEDVAHYHNVISEDNQTHCIQLNWRGSLASLPEEKRWINIPMYIMLNKLGDLRDVFPKLNYLRELNARIFLPSDSPDLVQNIQILASLGINCGFRPVAGKVDWSELNDLMHYAVYGKVPHASIEPFDYLLREYKSNSPTDFDSIWFQNPRKYLHVNKEGKVAFTSEELLKKNFILDSLHDFDKLEEMEEYKAWFNKWQQIFLNNEACASCPAWRVCLGKYKDFAAGDPGCKELFSDIMDAVDFVNDSKNKQEQTVLCRP